MNKNTTEAQAFEDLVGDIRKIDVNLLKEICFHSTPDLVLKMNFWREELQRAPDDYKKTCNQQIALVRDLMIQSTKLTAHILQVVETEIGDEIAVDEEPKEESTEERGVIKDMTGKVIETYEKIFKGKKRVRKPNMAKHKRFSVIKGDSKIQKLFEEGEFHKLWHITNGAEATQTFKDLIEKRNIGWDIVLNLFLDLLELMPFRNKYLDKIKEDEKTACRYFFKAVLDIEDLRGTPAADTSEEVKEEPTGITESKAPAPTLEEIKAFVDIKPDITKFKRFSVLNAAENIKTFFNIDEFEDAKIVKNVQKLISKCKSFIERSIPWQIVCNLFLDVLKLGNADNIKRKVVKSNEEAVKFFFNKVLVPEEPEEKDADNVRQLVVADFRKELIKLIRNKKLSKAFELATRAFTAGKVTHSYQEKVKDVDSIVKETIKVFDESGPTKWTKEATLDYMTALQTRLAEETNADKALTAEEKCIKTFEIFYGDIGASVDIFEKKEDEKKEEKAVNDFAILYKKAINDERQPEAYALEQLFFKDRSWDAERVKVLKEWIERKSLLTFSLYEEAPSITEIYKEGKEKLVKENMPFADFVKWLKPKIKHKILREYTANKDIITTEEEAEKWANQVFKHVYDTKGEEQAVALDEKKRKEILTKIRAELKKVVEENKGIRAKELGAKAKELIEKYDVDPKTISVIVLVREQLGLNKPEKTAKETGDASNETAEAVNEADALKEDKEKIYADHKISQTNKPLWEEVNKYNELSQVKTKANELIKEGNWQDALSMSKELIAEGLIFDAEKDDVKALTWKEDEVEKWVIKLMVKAEEPEMKKQAEKLMKDFPDFYDEETKKDEIDSTFIFKEDYANYFVSEKDSKLWEEVKDYTTLQQIEKKAKEIAEKTDPEDALAMAIELIITKAIDGAKHWPEEMVRKWYEEIIFFGIDSLTPKAKEEIWEEIQSTGKLTTDDFIIENGIYVPNLNKDRKTEIEEAKEKVEATKEENKEEIESAEASTEDEKPGEIDKVFGEGDEPKVGDYKRFPVMEYLVQYFKPKKWPSFCDPIENIKNIKDKDQITERLKKLLEPDKRNWNNVLNLFLDLLKNEDFVELKLYRNKIVEDEQSAVRSFFGDILGIYKQDEEEVEEDIPKQQTVKEFLAKNENIDTLMVEAPNGQIGYWISREACDKYDKGSCWEYDEKGEVISTENLDDEDYEGLLPKDIANSDTWKVLTKEEVEERFPNFEIPAFLKETEEETTNPQTESLQNLEDSAEEPAESSNNLEDAVDKSIELTDAEKLDMTEEEVDAFNKKRNVKTEVHELEKKVDDTALSDEFRQAVEKIRTALDQKTYKSGVAYILKNMKDRDKAIETILNGIKDCKKGSYTKNIKKLNKEGQQQNVDAVQKKLEFIT